MKQQKIKSHTVEVVLKMFYAIGKIRSIKIRPTLGTGMQLLENYQSDQSQTGTV